MDPTDLSWRAEEACMAAWPAPRELLLEGWLLRAAGGGHRRPNSVNPIRGGASDPSAILPTVETIYGAFGQTPLFRVLSFVEETDAVLDRNGYAPEGETLTLYGDIDGFAISSEKTTELAIVPGADWLQARAEFSEVGAAESRIYEAMLGSLLLPRAFATTYAKREIAALAYGVVCNGLGVIESVVTDKAKRRQGYARRTVGRLLQWAKDEGAYGVCLQVVADNAPAIGLYRSLGFTTELHRYHYRRKR
ncbi:GNAT family N-acetyltransferase [Pelagibius marinus]|uniref:GNAT family N-acetyltransferase n=1 Tax=Pelagibius marinus TaxID=2762760 RepID=UPI0018727B6B|nr:GNAT family N-acetyltransferase [Pelagibius marinus]